MLILTEMLHSSSEGFPFFPMAYGVGRVTNETARDARISDPYVFILFTMEGMRDLVLH